MEVGLFQSIGRGWTFLKQSWLLGQRVPAVLFPIFTGLVLSMVTLVILAVPLGGLIMYIRKDTLGQVMIGVVIGLILLILLLIANIMRLMSSNLSGAALSGQNAVTADAWKRISALGGDAYYMGLGYPVYRIWLAFRRMVRSSKTRGWEDAEHLLVPVLANETVHMRQPPEQIIKMQAQNCVFTAESVGIHKTAALLTLGALIVGLAAGLGVAWLVLVSTEDASLARALAFGLAALLTAIFSLPVALFSSFAITLFNTCLYQWGINVRDARKGKTPASIAVPEPLAIALGIRSGR
jgi:hypothetical protein